jgi:flagellar hook-basal body complex protein FliE
MVDINIQSIGQVATKLKSGKPNAIQEQPAGTSFGQWLSQSIQSVSQMQEDADLSALKLATGENKDIHGTMIKMQKTEIAIDLMVEVRNKVIAAYDEIKRMNF